MNLVVLIIAIIVYSILIFRKLIKIPPWVIMSLGAMLMLTSGTLSLNEALQSINLSVILFLITLFIFASALEISGFLSYIAYRIVTKYNNSKTMLFFLFLYSAILSNLITNDGVAASFTPVILEISKLKGISEIPLLYTIAMGVTIGSVMLPTGNPQNLLIALSQGLPSPFITFILVLGIPTIINILLSYPIIYLFFKNMMKNYDVNKIELTNIKIHDEKLAKLSLILLIITIILFFIFSLLKIDILLASIITSTILLLLTSKRREIVKNMDWMTIIFFINLFIFTEGLVKGGVVQFITQYFPLDSILSIFLVSIIVSQLISNVPLVALILAAYQNHLGPLELLALAAGSTIAGNFTVLGAASNIIISEASETRGGKGFEFFEFIKYTFPILIINVIIYYLYIIYIGNLVLKIYIGNF
ncbi:MAG: SLC13 family permease [Sulfolobaceae archaeon]